MIYDIRSNQGRREPTGSFVALVSPSSPAGTRASALSLSRLRGRRHPCAQPAAQGQGLAVPVARRLGAPVCLGPTLQIGVTQLGGIQAVPPGNRAVRRFQDSQRGHCAVTSTCLTPGRGLEGTALAPGIRVRSNVVRSRGARPRAGAACNTDMHWDPRAYGSAPSGRGLRIGVRGKGRLGSMEYRQLVAIPYPARGKPRKGPPFLSLPLPDSSSSYLGELLGVSSLFKHQRPVPTGLWCGVSLQHLCRGCRRPRLGQQQDGVPPYPYPGRRYHPPLHVFRSQRPRLQRPVYLPASHQLSMLQL